MNVPEHQLNLSNLRALLKAYDAVTAAANANEIEGLDTPNLISSLTYEKEILELLKGEALCVVNEINRRTRGLEARLSESF